MINAQKDGPILYMDIDGEFSAKDIAEEASKWMQEHRDIVGYIVDITQMTKHPAMEQRKAEANYKKQNPNVLRAIVGKDDAASRFLRIYMRFTKAENMHYFTSKEEAKTWILSNAA